jgi:hypothetical protein
VCGRVDVGDGAVVAIVAIFCDEALKMIRTLFSMDGDDGWYAYLETNFSSSGSLFNGSSTE